VYFDNFKQLFGAILAADRELMKQLDCIENCSVPIEEDEENIHTHQTTEPLERPRDSHVWIDLDKDSLGSVNIDLE
jgi:hypothetical protein